MNNSDTPTGENGNKNLENKRSNYQELNKKYVSTESLADKWDKFLQEQEGINYGKLHFECMSFEVPDVIKKERGGDENETVVPLTFENVASYGVEIVRPGIFINASKLYRENEQNKGAYGKAREKARAESKERREDANKGKNPTGGNEKPDKSER